MKFKFIDKYEQERTLTIGVCGSINRMYRPGNSEIGSSTWPSMGGRFFVFTTEDGSSPEPFTERLFVPDEYIETVFTEDGYVETEYCDRCGRNEPLKVAYIDGSEIWHAGDTIVQVVNPQLLYALGCNHISPSLKDMELVRE